MNYINHFNHQTENYRQFRPDYPDALFDYLLSKVGAQACVWDCATGSGQAAISLAQRFQKVIATDLNPAQLEKAPRHPAIEYRSATAENSGIKDQSIDLITVAQALHWFNFPAFYKEVLRVLKKNGWIAVWCYSLSHINEQIDQVVHTLYYDILGDTYWPVERNYIDEEYESIPFPFEPIKSPKFFIKKQVTLNAFMGYLSTWSAVKEYEQRNHINPLSLIEKELKQAWGDEQNLHQIEWPIHLLMANRQNYRE